jgi:osmotically-inducible protein OsmY
MRRLVVGLAITLATIVPAIGLADDHQIAQSIAEALKSQKDAGNLHGFKINLEVDQGTVWLKGRVTDDEQLALAVRIAKATQGVEDVVSDLTVEQSAASPRKFNLSRVTPLRMLKPDSAESPSTRRQQPTVNFAAAESSTPESAHVRQVSHDQDIAQAIFTRLSQAKQTGEMRNFKLDMNVEEGTVWLSGHVGSPQHKHFALDIASRTAGVVKVVDQISVNSVPVIAASTQGSSRRAPEMVPVANQPSPIYHAAPYQAAPAQAVGAQVAQLQPVQMQMQQAQMMAQPIPTQMMGYPSQSSGIAAAQYDHPHLPQYAWPSYAAHPNYGAVTYPQQYSPSAWPYIGPFYPYPQVPLGWREVGLKWKDGWWMLDFKER